MSNNFTFFSRTKQIFLKIELKYPTIVTFYALDRIFENIYLGIASNIVKFTDCVNKQEKVFRTIAGLYFFFIFIALKTNLKKLILTILIFLSDWVIVLIPWSFFLTIF